MFAVSMMTMFGTIVLLPFDLVGVLHVPVITVGLLLLPGGLIMGLLARSSDEFTTGSARRCCSSSAPAS